MVDCRHCVNVPIAEADCSLTDRVRDLERQSMYSAIMAELQRLTAEGANMDWTEHFNDDDDDEEEVPELTDTTHGYQTCTVMIPTPTQRLQTNSTISHRTMPKDDDALRGSNPIPTTAPTTPPSPMTIHPEPMSINM